MTPAPDRRLLSPFCVVRGGAAERVRRAASTDGAPLAVVSAGALAVIAAEAAGPDLARRRLRVLDRAVALGGAIALPPDLDPAPAREVAELLRRLEAPLEGVLSRVEGRAAVVVRATWDVAGVRRGLDEDDGEVADLLERVRSGSEPSYLARTRLARARAAALDDARAGLAAELRARLAPAVAAWRPAPSVDDEVVVRALCLVDADEEAELRVRARRVEAERPGVRVRCSPAHPPRSFARVPAGLAAPRRRPRFPDLDVPSTP